MNGKTATYDVAIVGAGPAGATLARLIARTHKVLLLERREFAQSDSGGKCCGGLLDPDAQCMLARFGLGLPKTILANPQMFAVRTIDFDNSIERYYQRHYVNTNRNELNKWLESLVPAQVDIHNGSVLTSFEVCGDHVRINYVKNNTCCEATSRLLVGADGACSTVRRHAFAQDERPKRYIALQEWFEDRDHIGYYGALFAREVTDYYSWIIPKDEHVVVGSALEPETSSMARFNLLKEKLRRHGFQLANSRRIEGTYIFRPRSHKQIKIGGGRIALIGEAAGYISPTSGEGISYAFKTALALAEALEGNLEDWESGYRRNLVGLNRNIGWKVLKSPFMYNRILRLAAMKAGVQSLRPSGPYVSEGVQRHLTNRQPPQAPGTPSIGT